VKVPFVAGLRSYHGPALLLVIELPAGWVRNERHLVQKKTVDTSCLPKFGRFVDLVWIKECDLIRISNVRWSPMWE